MITGGENVGLYKFRQRAKAGRSAGMSALVSKHGRLIVDNAEFRWLPGGPHVFLVARIARAVNCGAIEAKLASMTRDDVEAAAAYGRDYVVKSYASRLAPFTASVPLLAYSRNADGKLVLLDGRQRASRAFGEPATRALKTYVVAEKDAVRVGRHSASAEVVQLFRFLKAPLLEEFGAILKANSSNAIFTPVVELIRSHALSAGNDLLLNEVDRFARRGGIHQEEYKLLEVTKLHPVVLDRFGLPGRANDEHTNQLAHVPDVGRPNDRWREKRVKLYYSYFALRLVAIENEIRLQNPTSFPAFQDKTELKIGDYKRGGGQLHKRRRSNYDKYLKAHWQDMGLLGRHSWEELKIFRKQKSDLYLRYETIEDTAARTVRKASEYTNVDVMRADMAEEVARLLRNQDSAGLSRLRDRAIEQFRLLTKAFVRMRQWRPAKQQLLAMEGARTMPASDKVHRVARWDLDAKATLVDLDSMISFSELTGVVATDIWPLYLPYNTLFECYALLHGIQHREYRIAPVAVEAFLYRAKIVSSGGTDDHETHWNKLFGKFFQFPATSKALLKGSLLHIDGVMGLDLFDRQNTPNGRDFLEEQLSYFESR